MFIIPLVEVQQEQFLVTVEKPNQRGRKKMGDLKYKVGDVVELKESVDDFHFVEIVEVHPDDMFLPYLICKEDDKDSLNYRWITEDEIECLVHSAGDKEQIEAVIENAISKHIKNIAKELIEIVKEIENYGNK